MKSRLVWLLLCCIWARRLFIKLGLENLPPLTFAGIRFLIAPHQFCSGIVAVRRVRFATPSLELVAPGDYRSPGVPLNYGLLFWGSNTSLPGLARFCKRRFPHWSGHRSLLSPGERMTPAKIFGVVMGVAGVGVIFQIS